MIESDVERYADPLSFAKEVNLPLLGTAQPEPVPIGANTSALLAVQATPGLAQVVDGLVETRRSLTLRSLLLAGFPEDPECFAVGLAIAREWSRRGMTLAVVDLDFWHPTVVRPRPHPNEGIVDVLEYGCSFRRVAWEIVANSLWVVGPGSHPPDPDRIAGHPDWERAARGFAAHVEVTLFVAPLLHRRGLVGRLSKKMDGALLAASVERVGRSELRDAFLELWGSDAPIIGCVGIEPSAGPKPAATPRPAEPDRPAERRSVEAPEERPGFETPERPAAEARGGEEGERRLAATLEREVRNGTSVSKPIRRSRTPLVAGLAGGLAIAASIAAFVTRNAALPPGPTTPPTGAEQGLPAEPERTIAAGLGGAPATDAGARESGDPSGSGETASPGTEGIQPGTVEPDAGSSTPAPGVSTPDMPFRVHVASFRSRGKVGEMVRGLRLRGVDAWYERADDAPGYFRVYAGHFATEGEARAYARWLLNNGWADRAQAYPSTER